MKVEIEKARELGFCFGVRRAIKLIQEAAEDYDSIATLGPIVHNRLVVDKLSKIGVNVINELNQFSGKAIAITSHGAPPEILSQIESRSIPMIDTTCPIVRSAQKAAKKLSKEGFNIIIFGEAAHPEVKGLLGWAGDRSKASLSGQELNANLHHRLGVISQTTQGQPQFQGFIKDIINIASPSIQELRIVNTLCRETQKRQEAALELAYKSDLMIVVGGRNSANTKHLAEICLPHVETYLIETAVEIQDKWIKGKQHIGITAGASTPDEAIDEVISRLKALTGSKQPD